MKFGWEMRTLAALCAGAGFWEGPTARGADLLRGPALYDNSDSAPSKSNLRVRPMGMKEDAWKGAPFYFIQTELSPATLYHCASHEITFFGNLKASGLGPPAFAGFDTWRGPRVGTNGAPIDVS